MKKMKVAFLIAEEFPEKYGSFILDQATGLIDQGIDIRIFALGKDSGKREDGKLEKYGILERTTFFSIPRSKFKRIRKAIPIFLRHPFKSLRSLNSARYGKMALTLNPLLSIPFFEKINKCDILHCHFGHIGLIGSFIKDLGFKGNLLVSFYGTDMSNYLKISGENVYSYLFKNADSIIANVNFLKNKLLKLGCPIEKISVIPVSIDPGKFIPKRKKKANRIRILTVGRLKEEKGHVFALKAVKELIENYNIEYKIVGSGPDLYKLKNLSKELGMEPNVRFLGYLSGKDLLKEYQNSDIFLSPSLRATSYASEEAQLMANQEAQLMEIPVITTDVGGISEGVLDGETGFVIQEKNYREIEGKLRMMMDKPSLIREMGKKGRRFVIKKYSPDIIFPTMKELYLRLIRKT